MLRMLLRFAVGLAGLALVWACGRGGLLLSGDDLGSDPEGLGSGPPTEDPIVSGCPAVDYLFVIDNSGSMADTQDKLAASFGPFVEQVQRSLETVPSLHVGVVTTDLYRHNSADCRTLGGLVERTGGASSSQTTCGPYADGHAYMTGADDLEEAFACAAKVGTSGQGDEMPLTAAAMAVGSRLHGEGMCNEGFIRDDALLVVVVLTDEDEPLAAPLAAKELVAAKYGYRDNVVFVAIVDEPGSDCARGVAEAHEITALAHSFEHGFVGSICAEDYGEIFEQAVDVVVAACGEPD